MTKRRKLQQMDRWEADTRAWACAAARSLVYAICTGQNLRVNPYGLGVALDVGEKPWIEIPARFLNESPPGIPSEQQAIRPWLLTNSRIVGRLGDDLLRDWHWHLMSGCRFDLTTGAERITLDTRFGTQLTWMGPGVAPLAVTAVAVLYGPTSLVDHPALDVLRRPYADLGEGMGRW